MTSVKAARAATLLIGLALLAGLLAGCAVLAPMADRGAGESRTENAERETARPLPYGALELAVLTGSMEPEIPTGSLIVVVPVEPAEVRVGDIITFAMTSGNVTHRVVEILHDAEQNTYEFLTKGDANDVNDPWTVAESQLVGKFLRIEMNLNDIEDLESFIQERRDTP